MLRQDELEEKLRTLETRRAQLEAGLAEFRHSGRRVADGLERVGGRQADLERRRADLVRNQRLTKADLESTRAEIQKIRRALAEHAADGQD